MCGVNEVVDNEVHGPWGKDTEGDAEGAPCDWNETANDKAIVVTSEVGMSD